MKDEPIPASNPFSRGLLYAIPLCLLIWAGIAALLGAYEIAANLAGLAILLTVMGLIKKAVDHSNRKLEEQAKKDDEAFRKMLRGDRDKVL
jgi:hypothetical protein